MHTSSVKTLRFKDIRNKPMPVSTTNTDTQFPALKMYRIL